MAKWCGVIKQIRKCCFISDKPQHHAEDCNSIFIKNTFFYPFIARFIGMKFNKTRILAHVVTEKPWNSGIWMQLIKKKSQDKITFYKWQYVCFHFMSDVTDYWMLIIYTWILVLLENLDNWNQLKSEKPQNLRFLKSKMAAPRISGKWKL